MIARNNVVYSGNSAGISIGGYAAKRRGTDHCIVANNTLYNNDLKKTSSSELQIHFNATRNRFENNILYAAAQGLLVNNFTTSTSDPAAVDYNLYFSQVGADRARFVWQRTRYVGYDNYRNGTGLDRHSPPFSDPQFVNLGKPPNLDISRSSPAIGAGAVLDESIVGTHDFAGNPRVRHGAIDLGAYER